MFLFGLKSNFLLMALFTRYSFILIIQNGSFQYVGHVHKMIALERYHNRKKYIFQKKKKLN